MKIRLRRMWFGPDISGVTGDKYVAANGRAVARGHRLRKGVHVVPDEWRKLLPSDAVILDDYAETELEEDEEEFEPAVSRPKPPDELSQSDLVRQGLEHTRQIEEEAEETRLAQIKERRQAAAAKAREAKAAKKEKETDA